MAKGKIIGALAAPLAEAAIGALAGYIGSKLGAASAAPPAPAITAPPPPVLLSDWNARHPDQAADIRRARLDAEIAKAESATSAARMKRREKIIMLIATCVSAVSPFLAANIPYFHEALSTLCNVAGGGG